jgi:hypothetical protein
LSVPAVHLGVIRSISNATDIRRILRAAVDAKAVHDHLSRHHAGPIRTAPVSISGSTRASTCPAGKMRNRFHEPRSDPPSPRRLDDVNANKSLYGNKRETPSIRCHEPSRPTGRRPTPQAGQIRVPGGKGGANRAGRRGCHPSRARSAPAVRERADWTRCREPERTPAPGAGACRLEWKSGDGDGENPDTWWLTRRKRSEVLVGRRDGPRCE